MIRNEFLHHITRFKRLCQRIIFCQPIRPWRRPLFIKGESEKRGKYKLEVKAMNIIFISFIFAFLHLFHLSALFARIWTDFKLIRSRMWLIEDGVLRRWGFLCYDVSSNIWFTVVWPTWDITSWHIKVVRGCFQLLCTCIVYICTQCSYSGKSRSYDFELWTVIW